MNILLLSYADYQYDGRLRELMKVSKMLGHTTYYTYASQEYEKHDKNHKVCFYNKKLDYLYFLYNSIKHGVLNKNIDTLFIDNRRAALAGLAIKLLRKKIKIIQDVRELYTFKETDSFIGKWGCFIERKLYKYADVIICANGYRANIMKKIYNLKRTPLVYENIRKLNYSNRDNYGQIEEKFNKIKKRKSLKIISTSGCSIERTNDKLIEAVSKLDIECDVFLVGYSNNNDKKKIKKIISEKNLTGVHIINRLNEDELKYLISCCDIGIVNYGTSDLNNLYCASGKIYEFIFEGKPIVATQNPPLYRFCKKYKIGVASSDYLFAINEVISNYEYYKLNVNTTKSKLKVYENNKNLVEEIIKIIEM